MFGLGMTEIILIAVIALVVVGPKKLPDIAKSIGKGYGEFRRSFSDLKQSVNLEEDTKIKPAGESLKKELAESYKSQWEQKLPPAASEAPIESAKPEATENIEKTDDGAKRA